MTYEKIMRKIETIIEVNSSSTNVWSVFKNVDEYHTWNPFIVKIRGDFLLGSSPYIYVKISTGKIFKAQPTIKSLVAGKSMTAIIRKPFLFYGEHYFKLETIDADTTLFVQGEKFSGLIPLFFWWAIRPHILKGFSSMNNALKCKVENL